MYIQLQCRCLFAHACPIMHREVFGESGHNSHAVPCALAVCKHMYVNKIIIVTVLSVCVLNL